MKKQQKLSKTKKPHKNNSNKKAVVNVEEEEKQELYQIQYNNVDVQIEKDYDLQGIEEQLQADQWNYYYIKTHDDFSIELVKDLKALQKKKEVQQQIKKLNQKKEMCYQFYQKRKKFNFQSFCKCFSLGILIVWAFLVLYELTLSNMYNLQLLKQNIQNSQLLKQNLQNFQFRQNNIQSQSTEKNYQKTKLSQKQRQRYRKEYNLQQDQLQKIVVHKIQEKSTSTSNRNSNNQKDQQKQKESNIETNKQSKEKLTKKEVQIKMKEYQWSQQEIYNKDKDKKTKTKTTQLVNANDQQNHEEEYYQLKASQFKLGSRLSTDKTKMANALRFWMMTGKNTTKNQELQKFQYMEKDYYERLYQIQRFEEIQICVVVLSYMNQANERYKRNLDSIFQQDYENYKVYYVDDNSEDRTAELVKNYIKKHKLYQRMKFYQNTQKKGKSYNQFYLGQQNCKPGSVMVVIDGDDQLIGKQVFKLLSAAYQSTKAYYIYTNFIIINQRTHQTRLGFSKKLPPGVIRNRSYRHSAMPSHLRTWMADLFLDIQKQDLFYNGDFPLTGEDVGSSFLLMEKAGTKVHFLPQLVYRYVVGTGFNDDFIDRELQVKVQNYYRGLQKYPVYDKQIQFNIKQDFQQNSQQQL